MRKVILLGSIALMTGCGVMGHAGDHFQLSGTPDGIRAFGDTLNGAMKTAKEGHDSENQFLGYRAAQEREITKRKTAPGFIEKLFHGSKNSEMGS